MRTLLALLLLVAPAPAAIDPGPAAPIVGQMVARILEQNHYNRRPVDDAVSRDFLRNYIEMYDYNRMILERSDVAEFEAKYATTLDDRIKEGDVEPAFLIFDRFLQRLEEREALVKKVLASSPTFTADERFVVDRHELPWPATPKESTDLWRLRVKYELLQEKLAKSKPEENGKTVGLRYERLLRSYKEYDGSDVLQNYLTALAHAYDPHSDYMAAPQMENFNISMRLSLVGIGAVLRSEDGYAKIVNLVPGGPAEVDKRLKPNDKIEAIAQGDGPWTDAVGMKLDRLVQMIRGEKGTIVRLRVIPADAMDSATRVTIALVRDEIKLTDQEAKAKIIDTQGPDGKKTRIGVIDLPSFYADMKSVIEPKSTTRDVEKLINHLRKEGVDGLILDLRRNGGGSLSEAVALTGLFIPDGPVVQIKDARGLIKVLKDSDGAVGYAGPMLVLTSRASASASEILAAALQDYGRAVVVGEKSTFGKGTVQSIIELSQYMPGALRGYKPGAVKLTIQKFYRVSGGSTQHRGVIPDIQLPSLADHMDITETAQKNALPYDEVEPAAYSRINDVTTALRELQRGSAERVAANPEFKWVREDIDRFKKLKEQKWVSLNEKKRLDEKAAEEARAQTRKKERAAKNLVPLAATEVTLQIVDGLQPPPTAQAAVTVPADENAPEYEKAPPVADFVLEEGVRVMADLIGRRDRVGSARTQAETYTR